MNHQSCQSYLEGLEEDFEGDTNSDKTDIYESENPHVENPGHHVVFI